MSALARLFARARSEIAELGDAIVGSQAQRIVDQEIRDTDAQLHAWRNQLGEFQAHRLTTRERRDAAQEAIASREVQAALALQAGDAALAREVAAAVVVLEDQRDADNALITQIDEHIAQMRRVVAQGENTLRRLRHQLDMIRAIESVQRAQAAVASRQAGIAGMPTALDSADRLKARTQPLSADHGVDAAALQDAFAELDEKLRRAGIFDVDLRTDAVMQRVQARLHKDPPRSPR